ncbi:MULTISPECIES: Ldh family oxidoreductase [Streptomyces]|uniref:Malate dehydrogenase n=1 Tax=Streptomyces albus (strain ATCC 21838 / DSM 41398 / FERM P-419 / JCM 4703 / NBRC 107858) TaxID=1081613 RepID=A0A0B5ETM7_STRA4|nr:Ldh family oxidoreductase [Streptomyces sp. SCSIO ZS0520]AJE81457.1 malate dehydrogenase [Streptomyces albus]AOU75772.1 malate dehydrogenase [Streptomyces albus]AYN31576.1 lactate dehydrogenase [Streptomyces albus]UFZ14071.1 malate dehydrogenase [Streptomyces sp.]
MTTAPDAGTTEPAHAAEVRVDLDALLDFTAAVFRHHGLPQDRATTAARALVHGDLTGVTSHGLTNLTRLYLKLFADGRCDPAAEPEVLADQGAAVLLDSHKALGLWAASEAVDLAAGRALEYGVGLVTVRDATHLGCAGAHAKRAADRGMICLLVSNCGRQRIIRPPGGSAAMLGTNPLAFATPAGPRPPFVLDMSTTVVPTGRVRGAARAGQDIPEGWLEDAEGRPVTDPHALDRGDGYLKWLGGDAETGAFKGYGLGLLVETLGAMLPGAGLGPEPEAWSGSGSPSGQDDNIGFTVLVIAPAELRRKDEFEAQAAGLFDALTGSPAVREDRPVRYPGWFEGERATEYEKSGVPLSAALYEELRQVAAERGLTAPAALDD